MHTAAITSAAPGTCRATRRIAPISWVMVSWVATASSRIVESTARRRRPASTPVASITCRTASLTRCGRFDFAIRRRQYTRLDGSNPSSSSESPQATFHRRSQRTASAHSRSDSSCNACNVNTAAIRVAGNDGRPIMENRSAYCSSGNSRARCSASNANMLPSATR